MSQRALGRQWFHGSPANLEPGAVLQPPAESGRPATRGDGLPNRVYVTPHPFVAAHYTYAFDEHGKLASGQDESPHGHVYEVEPVGRTMNDKNSRMPGISYHAKSAVVKRRLDPKEWR